MQTRQTLFEATEPTPGVVDDLALFRGAVLRVEKEISAITADLRFAIDNDWLEETPAAVSHLVERLQASVELQGILRSAPKYLSFGDHVTMLCHAIARCAPNPLPPILLDVPEMAIDGSVGMGIALILTALIAGEHSGGFAETGGKVEIDVWFAADAVEIRVHDMCNDPPDRVAYGGRTLMTAVDALGATISEFEQPGIASVAISVPLANSILFRTVGNA